MSLLSYGSGFHFRDYLTAIKDRQPNGRVQPRCGPLRSNVGCNTDLVGGKGAPSQHPHDSQVSGGHDRGMEQRPAPHQHVRAPVSERRVDDHCGPN